MHKLLKKLGELLSEAVPLERERIDASLYLSEYGTRLAFSDSRYQDGYPHYHVGYHEPPVTLRRMCQTVE
jgi:hypothetical protein